MLMCTSSNPISRARGFTLLELLLVLLLMGLLVGVGLTLDFDNSPQQVDAVTRDFADAMELAGQQSILDGVVLGLDFFGTDATWGYRWLSLQDDRWQPLPDEVMTDLAHEVTLSAVQAQLLVEGQQLSFERQVELRDEPSGFAPEILVSPTREVTPFTLALVAPGVVPQMVKVDLLGRVQVNVDDETR